MTATTTRRRKVTALAGGQKFRARQREIGQ